MFDGFVSHGLQTARGRIFARVAGQGPPLLLLHGYPQTHVMWHTVADVLSSRFTVVVADLPGYGASFRPVPGADHAPHSKRALAADLVQAMSLLGFEQFAVAGHDRGGRVAYRMALDHPDRVSAAAVLDVVPTGEVWARLDAQAALGYWHWTFLAQPAPLPERLIAADPDAFFDFHVRTLGLGRAPDRSSAELIAGYRALLDDTTTVAAICEDYRAGATIDRRHDDTDRGVRKIACPLLVLWGAAASLPRFYGDVLEVWRPWADDLTGQSLPAGHFLVEDEPEQTAAALSNFLHRRPAVFPLAGQRTRKAAMSPADDLAATLKRTETLRRGSSIPGRDIVQVRTEIPPGVQSGWHIHPGEEVGYIVAGTVRMEIRDQPTLTLHAGDGFLIPPRTPHNATDLGPETGVMLSTYLVETGRPLATFVH